MELPPSSNRRSPKSLHTFSVLNAMLFSHFPLLVKKHYGSPFPFVPEYPFRIRSRLIPGEIPNKSILKFHMLFFRFVLSEEGEASIAPTRGGCMRREGRPGYAKREAMPPNAVNLMYFRGLKPIYVDEKRAFLGEDTGGTPVLQKKVHGVACLPKNFGMI
jgi:hypothetical protein